MIGPARHLLLELIAERKEKGIRQTELAKRMGLSRAWVANLENRPHEPSLLTVINYATALKLTLLFRLAPMNNSPVDNPFEGVECTNCGAASLRLEVREQLVSKPIGTFSLAGMQMKTSAFTQPTYWCVCDSCESESMGKPASVDAADIAPEDAAVALHAYLEDLHEKANLPSSRVIARDISHSHSTVNDLLKGKRMRTASWRVVRSVTLALNGDAAHAKSLWLAARTAE